jgi:hypothetical protein
MVSVSREAPLNNLGQFFGAVAAGTRIPGSKRTGLAPLLDRLQGRGPEVGQQLEAAGIPERLRLPVEAYLSPEMTHRDELLADISGQWLLVSQLKKILRDRGLNYRMAKYAMARDPIWLYHLLAELVIIAGLKGWLIVLDELELIGKTSIKARADAYAHLYTLSVGHELPHTVIVGAVASNYYSDVLEERNDSVKAPAWYHTRRRVEIADAVHRGIEQFARADRLPTLSPDELHTLLATIRTVHGIAYSWEPPPLDEMEAFLRRHVKGADEKLRTRIRMAVQWLDVWHQHQEEPDVVVWSFGEVDLTETDDPEAGGDDDNGPVTRKRLF